MHENNELRTCDDTNNGKYERREKTKCKNKMLGLIDLSIHYIWLIKWRPYSDLEKDRSDGGHLENSAHSKKRSKNMRYLITSE